MGEDRFSTQGIQSLQQQKLLQKAAAQRLGQYAVSQEVAQEKFQEWVDENAWNPLALTRSFQPLERRVKEKTRSSQESKSEQSEEEQQVAIVEQIREVSENFERKNPELPAKLLLALHLRISDDDSVEDIVEKLRATFSDISLADEALDFLIEVASSKNLAKLQLAKERMDHLYAREIQAGKNIATEARNFSVQGLGSPTALRDLYRDITGNPREANALFQELSSKYSFEKMKPMIEFMLHSIGSDLKSKGPSIPRSELLRLMSETKNMQAILGVYRFFASRMPLIITSFDREALFYPTQLSFEFLAKTFVRFIQERYPSASKVQLLSPTLGIADNLSAQAIVYLNYRDAVRQISPRLFKNEKQRQDLLASFIETLEEIEKKMGI